MADLEQIIAQQVEAAGGGEGIESPDVETVDTDTDPDTSEVTPDPVETETPDPADTSNDPDPDKPADKVEPEVDPATGKPVVKPVEKDELTKELEALGLKEPKEGERENRLPFKRVKKITENYGKKVAAKYEAELTPLKAEVETLRTVKTSVANVDRLIASDPDRYITMLAGIHPEYKKFLQGGKVEGKGLSEPVVDKAVTALGERPKPDAKFEDGSEGYSPAQHEKLLDWVAAKATAEAEARANAALDKRLGPIENERKGREELNKRVEGVKQEAAQIRDMYGADVVAKYEDKIVAHMKANPTMGARQAAREVIMPALQADRNKMRTEILAETAARPKAASKTPVGQTKKTADEDGPRSLEQVIAEAVATLK